MGAECGNREINYKEEDYNINDNTYNKNKNRNVINLNFKNYQDYYNTMQILKDTIKDTISNIITLSKFKCPKKINPESSYEYFEYMGNINIKSLTTFAYSIYQKIGEIYKENIPFPKEELSKINYSLISKYKAYENQLEDEEYAGKFVIDKIIRRINFFTEEFPFKLKNLDKIILSKKIYCFGYDRNLRINIYLELIYKIYYLQKLIKMLYIKKDAIKI